MRSAKGPETGDLRDASDEALVGLMANSDEAALRELFRRYAPFLLALVRRMGLDLEARGLVHDVFVRLWEESKRFDPIKAKARTWIVTTAHRMAVNRLREAGGRHAFAAAGEALGEEEVYVSEALDRLDPLARQLLELAFFGGRDHPGLVEASGRSPATVKTTMKRALASLRGAGGGSR